MEKPARTFSARFLPPVVTGGEFEVHTSPLAVACFVLHPNVGNWNLSSNHLKPMPFGNEMFLLGRRLARTELGEIVVEALLHLVVENDPEISGSLLLDLLGGLLIEPVEFSIVVGFAGLSESVVENLTFAGALRRGEETMAVLGGGAKAHGEEGQLSLGSEASCAHRPAQPSPVRGYLSHTGTPNRRWQNRECCQQVPIGPAVIFRHCWSARNPARVAF